MSVKTTHIGILGVNRSTRDHFFRIPHTKIGFLANFQLKRTYLDQNIWTHRSMTPQNDKNWAKKIFFPYSPKSSPNHMKLSVDVRNEVYNWFRVLLVLDSLYSFDNLNDQFRACFWPKVKNLTCTIPSVNPIGHFWLGTLFSTIFMQKIRGVTLVSTNFSEF